MARKPKNQKTLIDEDLGAGIGPEDADDEQEDAEQEEEDLVKIIEPPPNENRSGIVIEDADIPSITGSQPSPQPVEEEHKPAPRSPSAQAQADAEEKLGRENVAKAEAAAKKAKADAKKAEKDD